MEEGELYLQFLEPEEKSSLQKDEEDTYMQFITEEDLIKPDNCITHILEKETKQQTTTVANISETVIYCPYCKSANTKKIGVVGRSMSFGLFGFGSGKVGKQWHCNKCKSDF